MSYRKLWIALGLVLVISFAVLGGVGIKVLKSAPPIPSQVVTTDGRVLFDGAAPPSITARERGSRSVARSWARDVHEISRLARVSRIAGRGAGP
jgi:hypothetical protein